MRRYLLGLCAALCVLLGVSRASAQFPVIESGREADVLALFNPYVMGGEITPGWRLWDVSIQTSEVQVELRGPGEPPEVARLVLAHRSDDRTDDFDTSASFNLSLPTATRGQGREAALALAQAVKRNDRGTFWRSETYVAPKQPETVTASTRLVRLARDPLLHFALFIALVTWMLGADFLQMRPTERGALLAVLALGAVLRLTVTREMALDAWPFSRAPTLATNMFSGSLMTSASQGHVFFFTEYIFQVGLVCGLLGPAVVFLHARRMLGSARAGIFAAFLLAIWPSHLRFSHADGTFIASIVFSGMAFALTHDALRHQNRSWRWGALGALVPVLLTTLSLRPLNQIFGVLLFGVAVWLPGEAPRRRRALVAGVIALSSLLLSAPDFLRENSEQVKSGLTPRLVAQAAQAFFSYDFNTFIRLDMTPPLGVLLAGVGAWTLWRHKRRVSIFLSLWFAAFFVTHSYIRASPPEMQARYHLHLIVPVILLAAAGAVHLLEQRKRLAQGGVALLCLTPLLHLDFIRDRDFNQPSEHRFVHSLRPLIPEGCNIVEYVGQRPHDARFARVGDELKDGERRARFNVMPVETHTTQLDALLKQAKGGGCARIYLGIECYVDGEPEAAACAQLRAAATKTIQELELDNRVYDKGNLFKDPRRERFRMGLYSLD